MLSKTHSIISRDIPPSNLGDACTRAGAVGASSFAAQTPLGCIARASLIPAVSINLLHGSSAAERRAVNATVTGSIPVRAAIVEVKRIGKQLVSKTGARKGCRFESMPPPPFRQHPRHASVTTACMVGDRQAVRQPALTRFSAGSNPALPGSCLSSSSPRPSVVSRATWARIPPGT